MIERAEVPLKDRWNVEALYPTLEAWYQEFESITRELEAPHWPKIQAFKGRLAQAPEILAEALKEILIIDRKISKLYTYAHLKHDEDLAEPKNKEMYERIFTLAHLFQQEKAWFDPEVLLIPKEKFDEFLYHPSLQEYRLLLERIARMRPYTLNAREEEIMALSSVATSAAQKAFSAFNNADLKFPSIQDGKGAAKELTHASYLKYLRDDDRVLRKNAFQAMQKAFAGFENTLAEFINGQVQRHLFSMRARGFKNCMEAALFPYEVDPEVYKQLIKSVRARLSVHHRYMKKRKEWMGLEELHLYDLHVPLVTGVPFTRDYETAASEVCESVAVLGKPYKDALERGLFSDRWVDRYENARKRSGAYSSGCYDSMPYVLMNFQGTLNDVKTLAHECGHSMHSFFSRKNQPYQYADYAIFVAEVASTFNEELLMQNLMDKSNQPDEKALLINQRLDDIRATFFRQTMFAEFELKIHELAQQGVPLTATLLKSLYRDLNKEYFGEDVVIDEEIDWEWARIPHFYYNFYVYQYATGISAAFALFEKIRKEPEKTKGNYLRFLSSGSSKGPLEILADAGVDMRKSDAVEAIMSKFDDLVTQLDEFFKKKNEMTKRLPKIPASSIS